MFLLLELFIKRRQTKSNPPCLGMWLPVCDNPFPTHSLPAPSNVPQIVATGNSSEPIPAIDALYSPKFPLEVVREFVMGAILEAVEINQVHNRDPIGGSNENLFL